MIHTNYKVTVSHLHILSLLTILTLCFINIRDLDHVYILNDEFGYWAHAVSFVGYDWKELISETPYYSWGYSLWLIPIVAILPTPSLWYKAAILLNVCFLICSYFICFKIGRKLFPSINPKIMALISMIVIIYPSNIDYSQIAWTETLCYFLFWLETYILSRLEEEFCITFYVLSVLVALYSYSVHNRNIGILISFIITITIIMIKHRVGILSFLTLPIFLIIGYKGIDLVKLHQIKSLWSSSKVSSVNNVGINSSTIASYTSRIANEMKLSFISVAGKLFYILISFELLLPSACIAYVKEVYSSLSAKRVQHEYIVCKLWIFLSSILMLGVCSLQMNHWESRKDMIVYSRYFENTMGPLLLLSIAYAVIYVSDRKKALVISLSYIMISILPIMYMSQHASGNFNYICSPFISVFFWINDSPIIAYTLIAVFAALVFFVYFMSCSKTKKQLSCYILLFVLLFTYFTMGLALGNRSAYSRKGYYDEAKLIRNPIIYDYPDKELYYVKNTNVDQFSTKIKYVQFSVPDRTIHVLLPEELPNYYGKDVIIMTNPSDASDREYLETIGAELIENNYLASVYYIGLIDQQ